MTHVLDDLDPPTTARWTAVCRVGDLQPERAVCAVVGGRQVAIARTFDGEIFAVGQRDPFSGAFVLSRGIVGTRRRGDVVIPVLQSPLFKQAFDLRTGRCLDDPTVTIPVFGVRGRDGIVEVSLSPAATDD